MRTTSAVCVLILAAAPAWGQFGGDLLNPTRQRMTAEQALRPRLVPSQLSVEPNGTVQIAVEMRLADGWVCYTPAPGGSDVLPASLTVEAPGLIAGEPLWPGGAVKTYFFGGKQMRHRVFAGRAIAYVPLKVPPDANAGPRTVRVLFHGQVCSADTCLTLDAPLPVSAETVVAVADRAEPNPAWQADLAYAAGLPEARPAAYWRQQGNVEAQEELRDLRAAPKADGSVLGWLALALLAGLTLNVMPCVLPVVPLRILSLAQMAQGSRRQYVTLGLAFAGGMMAFFGALAALNVILRLTIGQAVGVNELIRLPIARGVLAMVVLALAANLFGVFTVSISTRSGAPGERKPGGEHVKSAGMGLMLAVLATPCSFAVLAAVLAWAQFQPTWLGSLALLVVGAGMAGPHVLLASFPQLLSRLPKPGRWMDLLKVGMGFALLPVALWLISTLGTGDRYPWWVASFGVLLVFCLWMWAGWVRYDAPLSRKLPVRLAAVALAVVGGWFILKPSAPTATTFTPYSDAALAEAINADRPVLIEFTATWCIACQEVEAKIYDDPEVAIAIADSGVLAMKADVSDPRGEAAALLYGKGGAPPLTLLLPGGRREQVVLTGVFDKQRLIDLLADLPRTQ